MNFSHLHTILLFTHIDCSIMKEAYILLLLYSIYYEYEGQKSFRRIILEVCVGTSEIKIHVPVCVRVRECVYACRMNLFCAKKVYCIIYRKITTN